MELLSWLEQYGGGILAIVFFLGVGYVFYWMVVVYPKRAKAVFDSIAEKGYHPIHPPDPLLPDILAKGAPIFPVDPLPEKPIPEWTVQHAVVLKDRIIANAFRTQMDRLPAYSTHQGTTMLIDTLSSSLKNEFHLVPVKRSTRIQWNKRHGLQAVVSGLDPDLLAHYEIYARQEPAGGMPSAFVKALIQAHPTLSDRSLFCFQNGVSLRFQPTCWGICTSHTIYRKEDMLRLIDIADAITRALKSDSGTS